jgi:hypothetical protein
MTNQPKLVIALTLALSAFSARADTVGYVLTSAQGFGTVNLTTGSYHYIGPGTPDGGSGLVRGPGGSLLTLGFTGNLDSINPATGVSTVIGATGLASCFLPTDACGSNSASALGSFGSTLYATDLGNNIYTVNPTTGAATLLGATGLPGLPFILDSTNPDGTLNVYDEVLFAAAGNLYLTFDASTIDFSTFTVTPVIAANLYRINPTTGVAALIGPTSQAITAVVNSKGATYGFKASTGEILTLDLSNGNTSHFSDYDQSVGVVGGASPVPEPSSIAMFGTGLAALTGSLRGRLQRRRTA